MVRIALEMNRRPSQSKTNKRLKWEHQCEDCGQWFPRKEVSVDHDPPVGPLTCYEDLPGFVERLFCEVDGVRIICHQCHLDTTVSQEMARRKLGVKR